MENSRNFIKPEEYRLYVTNLPVELTEEGISEIFDHYGKVTGLFYRPNATWTFVTYRTYSEAEYALRDLHDKPPLYLKVSFGKEATSNRKDDEKLCDKKSIESYEHPVQDSLYENKARLQSINRGKHISGFYKERVGPLLSINRYESNDLACQVPIDPYTFDPFESIEPYNHKNSLWTRGTVTVTRDGKRHVSYGRGYTSYEIPDPNPKIGTFLNQIYEKRLNGLYEHGEDTLKYKIGKCTHCGKPANMKCERCSAFYCNRDCQLVDWANHKNKCYKIPALIENTKSLSISSTEENTPTKKLLQTEQILRRPKQSASQALHKSAGVEINRNTNIRDTDFSREENFQNDHQINNTTKIDNDASELITIKKDNAEKKERISSSDALEIEESLAFEKGIFLSKKAFLNVKIVSVVENGIYWVQNCHDKRAIINMEIKLMERVAKKTKVKPLLGEMYAYKCNDSWKRVYVTSLDPSITIFFVDYGITMIATNDDFRYSDLTEVPPFAIKIAFTPSAENYYGTLGLNDIIPVKAVKFTNDMVFVTGKCTSNLKKPLNKSKSDSTAENGQQLSPSKKKNNVKSKLKPVLVSLLNVLETLSENTQGYINVRTVIHDNVYGITIMPGQVIEMKNKITQRLNEYCNNAEPFDKEKISLGQLVCGKSTDSYWYRGCVVGLQPIQLALLDEVIVMPVLEVVPCPDEFLDVYKLGVVCKVTRSNYKLKVNDIYKFKVISCTDERRIEIEIQDDNKIEAVLTQWEPKAGNSGIKLFELKSGTEVCITSFLSQCKLYVRSLQAEDQEEFHKIVQEVAKCAQSAPLLEEPPAVGEMVLAQYTDDNFYRAIVTKVEKDEIMISYVDYGNAEKAALKKLRVLPAHLKVHPSCIAKVILKDVPNDVAITKDLSDYFINLTGREIPLICHFDGVPSTDGVFLTMANGESVNEKAKQLLIPNWKENNKNDKTVYTIHDIVAAKFEDSNENCAVVLNTIREGIKYIMCPLDVDLITNVLDVLPGLMNEYCEKEDYYIPRDNELCLGLYCGNWYRALCTESTMHTNKCQLFFLDYGNVEYVLHKDIRAMTKDFLTPASLSNICTVVNLAPTDEDGNISPRVLKRISELITPDDHVLIKIVQEEHEGSYTIELPEIHAKLVEEGLI